MATFLFPFWSRLGVLLSVFAGSFVGTAVWATTVRPIEVTCPVCGQKISALTIMSTNTFGGQDTDLLTRARGAQPLLIVPIVCTHCYYAGYEEDFKKEVQISEELKQKLRKGLKPPTPIKNTGKSTEVPAWVRYDLMAQTYVIRGKTPEELAITYHRASWAVRLSSDVLADLPEPMRQKAYSLIQEKWEEKEMAPPGEGATIGQGNAPTASMTPGLAGDTVVLARRTKGRGRKAGAG